MLQISKQDNSLRAKIGLVPSKSISNRLLIIRAHCHAPFSIEALSEAGDTVLLNELLRSNDHTLDAKDAGTAFRFMTAFLANKPGEWKLIGTDRMNERPVGPLVEALRQLGASIEYTGREGHPPLLINGKKLEGGKVDLDAGLSSQFASAILLIAPVLKKGLRIRFVGLVSSRPYIEMTLSLMAAFGIAFQWDHDELVIPHQSYVPQNIRVETDWSSAAFWYEQAALSSLADLFLEGLKKESIQGDAILQNWMGELGVETRFEGNGARLLKIANRILPGIFEKDFSNHPDLVPAFACTCAGLGIPARLSGVRNIRIKESDRLTAIITELKKFGADLSVDRSGDVLEVNPGHLHSSSAVIHTHRDHRIAMAMAGLALIKGPVRMDDEKVVAKSYPGFWNDLQAAGYQLRFFADQN